MKIIKCPKCGKSGTPYYNLRNEITGYDCVPCNVIDIVNTTFVGQSYPDEISVDYRFHAPSPRIDRTVNVIVAVNAIPSFSKIYLLDIKASEADVDTILVDLDHDFLYVEDTMGRVLFDCQDFSQNIMVFNDLKTIDLKTTPMFFLYIDSGNLSLWLNTSLRTEKVIDL
jgi:hypothetical protein